MKTNVLLNEAGLGPLVARVKEEVDAWATAYSVAWYRRDTPSLHAEGLGQLTELIRALGQDEAVLEAVRSDLSAMAEWEGWDGYKTFTVNIGHFSWLVELLLLLKESPDMRQVAKWVAATSEKSWRAANFLDRVWGEAVTRHLRRQTEIKWSLMEEEGVWWIKEEWSGLTLCVEGGLPSVAYKSPSILEPAAGVMEPVEYELKCKFDTDTGPRPEIERLYRTAIDTVGETLLTEGLALAGVETLDLRDEGLYEVAEKLRQLSFSTQGRRERLALRVASNCAHERFFGR